VSWVCILFEYFISACMQGNKRGCGKFVNCIVGFAWPINWTRYDTVFSERELTFPFAICWCPSVCHLSVCNTRAPYSTGWNFPQYFYGIWYLGHQLTSTKNWRRSSQGNPLSGELNTRGVSKYRDFGPIDPKQCNIGGKLVLITKRKSHELLIGTKIGDHEWPWTA